MQRKRRRGRLRRAWLALLLLAGISMLGGVSRPRRRWGSVVQFGIAAIQGLIIAILFMRLEGGRRR